MRSTSTIGMEFYEVMFGKVYLNDSEYKDIDLYFLLHASLLESMVFWHPV